MKIIHLLFVSFILSSCACSTKTTPAADSKQNPEAELPAKTDSTIPDSYRFIVIFYSIGEGTEGEQITKFEKFVTDYGQRTHQKIDYEKSPWGREGEVNYCMKLSPLSSGDQQKFIDEVKETLKSAKWVHYSENASCGKRRK